MPRIAEPQVRIHTPPADSPSLSGFRLGCWKSLGFPPVWGRGPGGAVGRDAHVQQHRAEGPECLCRAIFQYRIAADAVRDGWGAAAKRLGRSGFSNIDKA